jgi:hypothetical protein
MSTDTATPAARRFGVLCSVSGGVTGSRSALLKAEDDPGKPRKPATFPTLEAAQAEARRLAARNPGEHSAARFTFQAVPL